MNNLRKIPESFNISDMDNALQTERFSSLKGLIHADVPLAEKTTFKVGGKAAFFALPENELQLQLLFNFCKTYSFPYFILGGGSNLVVSDTGIDKIVISTEKLDYITLEEKTDGEFFLHAGAGVQISAIIDFCIKNSLSGLENFAGLPGTAGGASFMNARCYNVSFSDVLAGCIYLDGNADIKEYVFNASDWDYKKSPFQMMMKESSCALITQVILNVKHGDSAQIEKNSQFFIDDRKNKGHFKYPSAGSVFKNNRDFGMPSGKLVDDAGLRGLSVGGAQVAPWHGNFIINNGGATASDIKELVNEVKNQVYKKTGFLLECEIIFTDNQ